MDCVLFLQLDIALEFSSNLFYFAFVWNINDVFGLLAFSSLGAQNYHHPLFKQQTIKNAIPWECLFNTSATMHWINTKEHHMKVIKLPSSIMDGPISRNSVLLLWDGWMGERIAGEEPLCIATLVSCCEVDDRLMTVTVEMMVTSVKIRGLLWQMFFLIISNNAEKQESQNPNRPSISRHSIVCYFSTIEWKYLLYSLIYLLLPFVYVPKLHEMQFVKWYCGNKML